MNLLGLSDQQIAILNYANSRVPDDLAQAFQLLVIDYILVRGCDVPQAIDWARRELRIDPPSSSRLDPFLDGTPPPVDPEYSDFKVNPTFAVPRLMDGAQEV
jgi:hypothetical protein